MSWPDLSGQAPEDAYELQNAYTLNSESANQLRAGPASLRGARPRIERSASNLAIVAAKTAKRDRALSNTLHAPSSVDWSSRRSAGSGNLQQSLQPAEPKLPANFASSCAPVASTAFAVRVWEGLLLLLSVWSLLETPYRLAFDLDQGWAAPRPALTHAALGVDCVFCVSVLLHAFHILPPHALPDAARLTILHSYVHSVQMYVDVLNMLPLDIIAGAAGASRGWQFSLGMVRVLRIGRIEAAFQRLESDVDLSYFFMRALRLFLFLFWWVHLFACIFYFVYTSEPHPERTWMEFTAQLKPGGVSDSALARYIYALYWSVVTFASVGYGDVTPLTTPEYVVTIVYIVVNVFVTAYIIGNATALATRMAENTRVFREQFRAMEQYARLHALPAELRREMRSFLVLRHSAKERHLATVLHDFPPTLRSRVARLLHLPAVAASPLLAGVSAAFLDHVTVHLQLELFMPHVDLLLLGDSSASELHFLSSGAAQLLALDEEAEEAEEAKGGGGTVTSDGAKGGGDGDGGEQHLIAVGTLGEGACFGELPFLFNLPQPFTVRATTLCRVLALKQEAWEAAAAAHPRDSHLVLLAAKAALAEAACDAGAPPALRSSVEPLVVAIAAKMAERDAERVADMCLAAGRNDVLSLRRALTSGGAANASDYDGRAPLHIAASRGADAAVRYLLDHGSDPNALDNFGNTPLYEAVLGGHATVAARLRASGAQLGLAGSAPLSGGEAGLECSVARRARDAGTLMCSVAASGDAPFLSALLANGLSPNACDYDSRTGLHVAAASGRTQVVAMLLQAGCNASAPDSFGRTPLLEAVRAGHEEAALALQARGGELGLSGAAQGDQAGGRGRSADLLAAGELCNAASAGDVQYVRRLLRFGCPPSASDYDSRTAAHVACSEGALPVALALLEAGADFGARDRWGHTPLHDAEAGGHEQLASVLRTLLPAE